MKGLIPTKAQRFRSFRLLYWKRGSYVEVSVLAGWRTTLKGP